MQTNHILSAPLIDIVFDGRNKAYGAYELRKTYEKRIRKALLVTGVITSLAIGTAVYAGSMKKNGPRHIMGPELTIESIPDPKKPEKLPEPEKARPEKPEVRTVRLNMIEVKPDAEVETPPPSQTDLDLAKIDLDTRAGTAYDGTVEPEPQLPGNGTRIIEPKNDQPDEPLSFVEIDARFDGNWKRFLETHLNGEVPVDNGAPAGRYSVVIRFVVDIDGTVSDITALTSHGYGLEEEAIRVIRKTKKWEPAFQNGVHVKAYKKQVIVFVVEEQ